MPAGVGKPIQLPAKSAGDTTSDALPPGYMASLSNLVPNPLSPDQWVPRPGAVLLPNTSAQFSPGFISCRIVVGNFVYGMVSSALNAGKDQPFCYNLTTQSFVTITGITAANVPTSPATTGPWVPPQIEVIGVFVVITHPGFNGAGNGFFGWINISNVSAPTWNSGNTSTNALPAVPTYVKQFFNRAYFVVSPPNLSPAVYATDALNPTSASQPFILTFGDTAPIIALGVLGLQNMFGGIIHALMVFKSLSNNVYQVTGDFAPDGTLGSIVINSLEIATTTIAANGVVPTPRGLAFISPDGLRIIDWQSHISPPIGLAGTGITQAFTQSLVPSRMIMSCNGQTIRITTQNNAVTGQPQQEWVYDLELQKWHGPHTFPYNGIVAFGLSYLIDGPYSAPMGGSILTGIWQSDIIPNTQSQYTENGVAMSFIYQTAPVANQGGLYEQAIIYTTVGVSGDGIVQGFTCVALDANQSSLSVVVINPPAIAGGKWGSPSKWGQLMWGFPTVGLFQVQIPWDQPLVFDRISFKILGMSGAGIVFGEMRAEVESLQYVA